MYLGVPKWRFGTVLVDIFGFSLTYLYLCTRKEVDDGRDAIHGCDDAVADGDSTGGVAAPQDVT